MDFNGQKKPLGGYTLLEILGVIAIIAFLWTLGSLAINNMLFATRVEEAGRLVSAEFLYARQLAATRNLNVELRFVERNTSNGLKLSEIRCGFYRPDAPEEFIQSKPGAILPESLVLDRRAAHSPLLAALPGTPSSDNHPAYRSLTIRPSGEVEPLAGLPFSDLAAWCITIIPDRLENSPFSEIANFATIQVDPITSRTRIFRP